MYKCAYSVTVKNVFCLGRFGEENKKNDYDDEDGKHVYLEVKKQFGMKCFFVHFIIEQIGAIAL